MSSCITAKIGGLAASGGHPGGNSSWSAEYVEHPCNLGSWPKADAIVQNDCGTSIAQMNGGNPYGKPVPAKAKSWVASGEARKQRAVVMYDFQGDSFMPDVIEAMGASAK